MNDFVSN